MTEIVFVDVQGFKFMNKFIAKEIYICTQPENVEFHAIINSPFPFHKLNINDQQQIKWLENKYHGIHWNDGNISLTKFLKKVQSTLQGNNFVCKGFEKCIWLQKIFNKNYLNLEDFDCFVKLRDNINDNITCTYHNKMKLGHCAKKNSILLRKWYIENVREINM